jgi:nucleoside-diphosphate-sugar epimerase
VGEKVVVTGAAGFIGSHLCERLLEEGREVVAIDSFTDYYSPARKRMHIARCIDDERFSLVEEDLNSADLPALFEGAECVFHLAAQAGVRRSWGAEFDHYTEANILATQKVLEALRGPGGVRLVHSSSSSVYGEMHDLPMLEKSALKPVSPYGATKLSAEHLCELYRINFGIEYTALRYFTVYGPRQRPDMAFSRFITNALTSEPIEIFGDGEQTRDFTFVADAVGANMLAFRYEGAERIFNIGGGARISILEVLELLGTLVGQRPDVRFLERAKGDVTDTWADTTLARKELGYRPTVSIEEGLGREVSWYRDHLGLSEGGTLP